MSALKKGLLTMLAAVWILSGLTHAQDECVLDPNQTPFLNGSNLLMVLEGAEEMPIPDRIVIIDDFEDYNDIDGREIWRTWLDGIGYFNVDAAGHEEYIEGNIRKRSIVDIWNDPNSFTYNRKFKKESLGENCFECKYGESCKGGCMGMSTALTNKPHNDPYCYYKIEQELFDDKKKHKTY